MQETRRKRRLRKLHNDGSCDILLSLNTAVLTRRARLPQHAVGLGELRKINRIYLGKNEE